MEHKLPKPKLRGLLRAQIVKNLTFAIIAAFTAASLKKVVDERKKATFAAFYANYDIDKEFQRMMDVGVFQSCP